MSVLYSKIGPEFAADVGALDALQDADADVEWWCPPSEAVAEPRSGEATPVVSEIEQEQQGQLYAFRVAQGHSEEAA